MGDGQDDAECVDERDPGDQRKRPPAAPGRGACEPAAGQREQQSLDDEPGLAQAAAVAFARCEVVSRRTGVNPESIWQWPYIERVSSGLFLLRLGHQAEARPFLEAAERLGAAVTPWPKTTG